MFLNPSHSVFCTGGQGLCSYVLAAQGSAGTYVGQCLWRPRAHQCSSDLAAKGFPWANLRPPQGQKKNNFGYKKTSTFETRKQGPKYDPVFWTSYNKLCFGGPKRRTEKWVAFPGQKPTPLSDFFLKKNTKKKQKNATRIGIQKPSPACRGD